MRTVAVLALVAACGGSRGTQPTTATVWGPPADTMVLGIEADGEIVNAFLENRGSDPQRVIATGVRLELERPGWRAEVHDSTGPTYLDRDDSFAVIAPGEQLVKPFDLGARTVEPGTYTVTATYNSSTAAVGDWWNGVLEAGPITVEIQ